MKKFVNYALLIGFMFLINVNAFASWSCFSGGGECEPGTTAAPLDGGLLAILAGAGITYYAARKRKKNKDKE